MTDDISIVHLVARTEEHLMFLTLDGARHLKSEWAHVEIYAAQSAICFFKILNIKFPFIIIKKNTH